MARVVKSMTWPQSPKGLFLVVSKTDTTIVVQMGEKQERVTGQSSRDITDHGVDMEGTTSEGRRREPNRVSRGGSDRGRWQQLAKREGTSHQPDSGPHQ